MYLMIWGGFSYLDIIPKEQIHVPLAAALTLSGHKGTIECTEAAVYQMAPQWSHSVTEASRRACVFPESSLNIEENLVHPISSQGDD